MPRIALIAAVTVALSYWSPLDPARAEVGDFEISLTSEALTLVSDTVSATTDNRTNFSPGARVGYGLIDRLTVLAGWRTFIGFSRGDRGYELDTDGHALVVGARYSLGLHPVVDLHGEVDLEAMYAGFDLEVAEQRGSTSAWAFGFIPKAVASVRADLDWIRFDIRAFVGFAFRTDLRADAIRLSSEAPAAQVAPLDLGRVNLSGLVFGTNLAVVF